MKNFVGMLATSSMGMANVKKALNPPLKAASGSLATLNKL